MIAHGASSCAALPAVSAPAAGIGLLISTLGVYLLTQRFITGPIKELTEISHQMMEGTFEGDIEVAEESDYADLQRLLKSGKTLVDKIPEIEE